MNLLDILIYVAATTFIVGWFIVILNALTGFRLIESMPSIVKYAFEFIHYGAFIGIAIILLAGLIWNFATGYLSVKEPKVVAGETYKEYDQRRDALGGSQGEFEGQGCTEDCGGHEAGYAWAEEKGIADPDHCGGKSWSFIEGCRAYAEQAYTEGE